MGFADSAVSVRLRAELQGARKTVVKVLEAVMVTAVLCSLE